MGREAPTEPFWTVWAVRPEGEVGTRDRAARTGEWGARRYGSERVAREEGGGTGRWEVRRGLGGPGGSGGGGRRHDLGVSSAKVGGREVRSLEFLTCRKFPGKFETTLMKIGNCVFSTGVNSICSSNLLVGQEGSIKIYW